MSSRDSVGSQTESLFGARNAFEEILVAGALVMIGTVILGRSTGYLHRGLDWMVDKHLLLARSADPLLAIPGAAGAGLDLPRTLIIAGVLAAVAAAAASTLMRIIRRVRHEREG